MASGVVILERRGPDLRSDDGTQGQAYSEAIGWARGRGVYGGACVGGVQGVGGGSWRISKIRQ